MKVHLAAELMVLVLAGSNLLLVTGSSRSHHPNGMSAIATSRRQLAYSPGAVAHGMMPPSMMDKMTRQPVVGDIARGKHVAEVRCAACHGAEGDSTVAAYPKLAGQKPDYLYGQLLAFKNGTRTSAVMAAMVAPLSDADLKDASVFFAGQARHSDPPGPSRLRTEGRDLFLSGSMRGQMLPACAACHDPDAVGIHGMGGMKMMGKGMAMMRREVPNLYGQHAAYIVSQLQAFADGTRTGMPMSRIAPSLTAEQRKAVAAYLAAHP